MMLYKFKNTLVVLACVLAAGCVANPVYEEVEPLSVIQNYRDKIHSTRVIVGLDPKNSENIQTYIGTSGQQFGLLGVLIEGLLANGQNDDVVARERALMNIRSAALKFNFGSKIRQQLQNSLEKVDWLKVKVVRKAPQFQRSNVSDIKAESREDVLIVVDAFYKMEEDLSKMTITGIAVAHPMGNLLTRLKPSPDSTDHPVWYKNKFSFDYPIEGGYTDKQTASNKWGQDNGAMVQRALTAGVKQVARLIAQDINSPKPVKLSAQ